VGVAAFEAPDLGSRPDLFELLQCPIPIVGMRQVHEGPLQKVFRRSWRRRGASSETYGLLGRLYEDRYEAAVETGDTFTAGAILGQAIETCRKGFEADCGTPIPGSTPPR
jgi:hypothetical protein